MVTITVRKRDVAAGENGYKWQSKNDRASVIGRQTDCEL